MRNVILVFAYYSFRDPLFQSAVLPYLKIARDENIDFILLTWEQAQFRVSELEREEIRHTLAASNIQWYSTEWNSGKFKFFKKLFDFLKASLLVRRLIRRHGVTKIYSEGFPGAIIGYMLSKLTGLPHIVHTFEPHADYMLESGVWSKAAWEYRLLKMLEFRVAKQARHIITGTKAFKEVLASRGVKTEIHVIPSCVDTSRFRYLADERLTLRSKLEIPESRIVIVYLGKLGGMYMDEEIFVFMAQCLKDGVGDFGFFLFTNEHVVRINERLAKHGIPESRVHVQYLKPDQVPAYLSAADIAFCGIRPIFSRRYSSPIKNGEYWACGLPILVPVGISDDYLDARTLGIGFAFDDLSQVTPQILMNLRGIDRRMIENQGAQLRGLAHYKDQFLQVLKD